LFVALTNINPPPRNTYNNDLNVIRDYVAANKPRIGFLKATFSLFFVRPMRDVADRVL